MKEKPKGDDLPRGLPSILRVEMPKAAKMQQEREKSGPEMVEEGIRLRHEWMSDATGFIA